MEESVLVVASDQYTARFGDDGSKLIRVDYADLSSYVESKCSFINRSIAERNPKYKQIVSYCLIRCGDRLFVTKRLKKQTETRLHEKWSIGIGGHINSFDCSEQGGLISIGSKRELKEEVFIGNIRESFFCGIINDNSTEVNSVHSGVCFIYDLEQEDCQVKETDKMQGNWMNISEIKNEHYTKLEGWSQIFIDSI